MPRVPDLVGRLRLDTRDLDRAKASVESFSRGAGSAFGDLDKGLVSAQRAFRNVGEGLANFGERASVGVTLPVVAGFGLAAKAASDLEEQTNKVRVVFGEAAGSVIDFSEDSAQALGQSQRAALEAAGTYGNLFRAIGVGEQRSAEMSRTLIQLSADLASFNNANPQDVFLALRAGLVGETEPLRKFGVNLNDVRLRAEALNLGLSDGKSVLDANAKAQAAYSLILKDTTLAQGDFARTSEGLANQTRIVRAELENAAANMGAKLIPAALQLVKVTSGLIDAFNALPSGVQNVALIGTAALAAVGPIAYLAGNALKLRAALNAAQAAAAAHSFGAGVAAAATVRLAGAVGKVGVAGAGLFVVAEGLGAIGFAADKATTNVEELAGATGEQLVREFEKAAEGPKSKGLTRILDEFTAGWDKVSAEIDGATRQQEFFNKVLEQSPTEAQRLVDALSAAGRDTADFQAMIDRSVASRGKAAVSREKDAAAIEAASTAARGATAATSADTAALSTNTLALGFNTSARSDAAEAAKAYEQAVEDILGATVDAANAEVGQRQAAASFADALADVADKERDLADARRARTSASRDAISEERALNTVEDSARSLADAERDLTKARQGRGDRARRLADAERDLADAQRDALAAKGTGKLADATDRVLEAQLKLNDARDEGGQAEDVAAAEEAVSRARLDVRDAELSLSEQREERAERERQAADAVKAAQDALAAAQLNAQTAALQAAAAARDLASSQAEAEGKPLSAAQEYAVYRDRLIEVKDLTAPGSELRRNLEGLIDSLPPPQAKVAVLAETTQADEGLERIRQQFLGIRSLVTAQGPTLFGPVGRSADEATTKVDGIRTSIGFIRRAAADPFRFVADVEPVTSSLLRVQNLIDAIRVDTGNLLAGIAAPATPTLAPSGPAAIRPGVASSVGTTTVNVTNNVTALGANEDVARDLDYRTSREVARAR